MKPGFEIKKLLVCSFEHFKKLGKDSHYDEIQVIGGGTWDGESYLIPASTNLILSF